MVKFIREFAAFWQFTELGDREDVGQGSRTNPILSLSRLRPFMCVIIQMSE